MIDSHIFLTFDIDWVPDEVLAYTVDILEKADMPATFFVTHDTPLLERLRANPKFELGIHPNLSRNIAGGDGLPSGLRVVEDLIPIVPDAQSYRVHSLTHSSIIKMTLSARLPFDCNMLIPAYSGSVLYPYRDFSRQWSVPHIFEDDVCVLHNVPKLTPMQYVNHPGLKVFDFHPIHVFLNTVDYAHYLRAKPYYQKPEILLKLRENEAEDGCDSFLRGVIEAAKESGRSFSCIRDIPSIIGE